jgi:2-hydroxy-6-oxonona-2,4-dienedioate hydrolase
VDDILGAAKWIQVAGIPTRYFEVGDGAAVVLVHGGEIGSPQSSSMQWLECFPRLSSDLHLIAFDRLGMGCTGPPLVDDDYTLAASAEHARRFIANVLEQPVHLVAHGSGARIALELCLSPGVTIASCTVLNSATVTPGVMEIVPQRTYSEAWEPELRTLEHYRSLCAPHSAIDKRLLREAGSLEGLDTMNLAYHKMCVEDLRTRVYLRELATGRSMMFKRLAESGVPCPMLLLNGADDPLVSVDCAALFVSALTEKQKDVELHLLADCGHYPQLEKGEIAAGIISEFIRDHAAAPDAREHW